MEGGAAGAIVLAFAVCFAAGAFFVLATSQYVYCTVPGAIDDPAKVPSICATASTVVPVMPFVVLASSWIVVHAVLRSRLTLRMVRGRSSASDARERVRHAVAAGTAPADALRRFDASVADLHDGVPLGHSFVRGVVWAPLVVPLLVVAAMGLGKVAWYEVHFGAWSLQALLAVVGRGQPFPFNAVVLGASAVAAFIFRALPGAPDPVAAVHAAERDALGGGLQPPGQGSAAIGPA